MNKPRVIDIFCGGGGFSEGFRQAGYEIVLGMDHWENAIHTFNHNFGLNCKTKDILDFEDSIEEIEKLPDTEVIIGSPPCVTFSSSNISGKADKSSGITLTQIFLRIVAVKKWKKDSILQGWFMENVPSSIKHLADEYTFEELGLGSWASKNKIGKTKVAIRLKDNQLIVNSADYGSPQARKRVISGEIIKKKKLIVPEIKYSEDGLDKKPKWRTVREILRGLPKPICKQNYRPIKDPNYPDLSISLKKLTDHFYDTGLYECEWRQSKYLKVNHPYMGKMSFPENKEKPSRTITATKIGTSREAIIYKSEYNRMGDGEFRTPTVREAACIMGFPITYQFLGGEGAKWRLVGNAVCPSVAKAFADVLNKEYDRIIDTPFLMKKVKEKGIINLNVYSPKEFKNPPKRKAGSRFRRHPFKDGNMTVTLSNYDIEKNEKQISKWITSVQYGNGEGFPTYNFSDGIYKDIEPIIYSSSKGKKFLEIMNNGFLKKIGSSTKLQYLYECQKSDNQFLEPTELVEYIAETISDLDIEEKIYSQKENSIFSNKESVPVKQLFALYALNKICSIANNNNYGQKI